MPESRPVSHCLLDLAPHERAICFVGFGTADAQKKPRARPQPGRFFSSL